MSNLRRYREKRDPATTPEPFGEETERRALPPGAGRQFVVQQHAARNMHWDLRLEIDDVLVSWAIPKGPTLDPAEKRLAVQTEDHPLEYGDFEGVIPPDNYGAGAMIVWDRGSYRTVDGKSPSRSLTDGKIDLSFDGHKLRGRFALVRTKAGEGRHWLLLCKKKAPPDPSEAELTEVLPGSVFSGLTVKELERGESREQDVERALRSVRLPRRDIDLGEADPMLATLADAPFSDPDWLFEPKLDGVRVLARRQGDEVSLRSRAGRDVTAVYPELTLAVSHLPLSDFLLDGEVVSYDGTGRTSFERLQSRFTRVTAEAAARARHEIPVTYCAFDLLAVAGRDLRRQPLAWRKALLRHLVPDVGFVRWVDHVDEHGVPLFEAAEQHGLEGVIAKRMNSRYECGRRTEDWRKFKIRHRSRAVVVGWNEGKGARRDLGSVLVAWHRDGELTFAGDVGSGLTESRIASLLPRLRALECGEPRFSAAPAATRVRHWIEPTLTCEVTYADVTSAGMLREPVFETLLTDVEPKDCHAPVDREAVAEAAPEPQQDSGLLVTRRDKVFWPEDGITKGDLVDYYDAAWEWLAPYLRDRPVVMTRYPDGIDGKSFFQKHAPEHAPPWAERFRLDGTEYFICNDKRTLLYLANLGTIPLHVWSARTTEPDRPDWLVLDLDPKEAPFSSVVKVARHVHQLLSGLDVAHEVKTSGQDGLHVMLPLGGVLDHDDARALAEVLARTTCAELPELATVARPLAARGQAVYVDFLQNGRGKLIAAPLSVRPRPGAPVSAPLRWTQVTSRLDPKRWTMRTVLDRLRRDGDPLRPILGDPIDVGRLLSALGDRLAAAES